MNKIQVNSPPEQYWLLIIFAEKHWIDLSNNLNELEIYSIDLARISNTSVSVLNWYKTSFSF